MQGRDLKKENDWFDRPASRRLLWRLLYGACTVSVLLELVLIATHQRHGRFGKTSPDGWWFFYALLGFIACALMILAAKGLGAWLKRPEDYYAETEETTLPEDIDESLR
jgi:hypothetical protein